MIAFLGLNVRAALQQRGENTAQENYLEVTPSVLVWLLGPP